MATKRERNLGTTGRRWLLERLEDRVTPASFVWVGPATGGSFNTATNWFPVGVPGPGDNASFFGATVSANSVNVNSLSGGKLLLSGALQTNSLSANVVGGSVTVVGNASGTLTNAAVSFNGGANVNLTLDACSLTGTFGLSNDFLTIRNGLTFNATLQMSGSGMEFDGTQTLGGTGEVVFVDDGTPDVNDFYSSNGLLTIQTGIALRGSDASVLSEKTVSGLWRRDPVACGFDALEDQLCGLCPNERFRRLVVFGQVSLNRLL